MTGLSLSLVLAAACLHATWNLLAKRAGSGGVEFVWLFGVASVVLYAPVVAVVVLVNHPVIDAAHVGFMVGSGVLHTCYFTVLQRGYKEGDLSLVYPLARGTGPMLSTAAAVLFFGEHPTALALAGAACVCVGVFIIGSGGMSRTGHVAPAIAFGLLTGCVIATYTLWDKHAVSSLAISAVLLDFVANLVRAALLTPRAVRRRDVVTDVWRKHRPEVIGVAILAPLAYILVLIALARTQVSYIAPAREVSILIGTILGVRVLKEEGVGVRLAGAAAIVGGLVCLALG
jgi:drug/metabolite transporter (DMT)-like permease